MGAASFWKAQPHKSDPTASRQHTHVHPSTFCPLGIGLILSFGSATRGVWFSRICRGNYTSLPQAGNGVSIERVRRPVSLADWVDKPTLLV